MSTIVEELNKLFPCELNSTYISNQAKQEILRLAWKGNLCSEATRAMCWRYLLGIISNQDTSLWKEELLQSTNVYHETKTKVMPSLHKAEVDPLSALSSGDNMSDEWSSYYKNVELTNFIKGDLDRLYLNGLPDEFFQTKERREILLSILFIWSIQHHTISYRQGMHEILGTILYTVECERKAWEEAIQSGKIPFDYPLAQSFKLLTIEPYTYVLFDRIMMELEPLYDPMPVTGMENQPFIVHYCTKIQEHYLQLLDPYLCQHLEQNYVQSQLYGLRWARLMLGREYPVTHNSLFRIWDFMFAACYDAEYNTSHYVFDDDIPPNVYSLLANARVCNYHKGSNIGKRASQQDRVSYVCTPLLGILGDFILAMLIQIREQLIEADQSSIMMYLMRYPEFDSINPILECADMIRRGVLVRDINSNGAVLNYNYETMATNKSGSNKTYSNNSNNNNSFHESSSYKVSKKMTDKIRAVVGQGINEIVNTFAPLLESGSVDDENYYADSTKSQSSARRRGSETSNTSSNNTSTNLLPRRNTNDHQREDQSLVPPPPLTNTSSSAPKEYVDPLLGNIVTNSPSINTTKGKSKVIEPSKQPVLNGQGTGYANMPDPLQTSTGVRFGTNPTIGDLDPLLAKPVPATPSTTTKSTAKSLFSPNWFPSSTAKSQTKRRHSRSSTGVDLKLLQSQTQSTTATQSNDITSLASNNAIGDRLLDIADHLSQCSNARTDGIIGEEDVFHATALRLRTIADVLAGMMTIVDYDKRYSNHELPGLHGMSTGSSRSLPVTQGIQPFQNEGVIDGEEIEEAEVDNEEEEEEDDEGFCDSEDVLKLPPGTIITPSSFASV